MMVLLPISRFLVEYEVGMGRPYSALEWMVLQAVGQGISSVEALREMFGMHPRLIVEALVTLTRAGWLAVGAAEQPLLLVTAEGDAAITRKTQPTSLQTASRSMFVLLERLTGAIVGVNDLPVRYATKGELEAEKSWEKSVRLPSLVPDNRVDESHVPHLLRREKGEWLRWIGPITMASKDRHWLPLNVDLGTSNVANLPAAWEGRLRSSVLAETARLTGASPRLIIEETLSKQGDGVGFSSSDARGFEPRGTFKVLPAEA